jgi:hypothetical protein
LLLTFLSSIFAAFNGGFSDIVITLCAADSAKESHLLRLSSGAKLLEAELDPKSILLSKADSSLGKDFLVVQDAAHVSDWSWLFLWGLFFLLTFNWLLLFLAHESLLGVHKWERLFQCRCIVPGISNTKELLQAFIVLQEVRNLLQFGVCCFREMHNQLF